VGRAQLPSFTILDSEDHAGATYGVGEGSVAAGLGTSLAGGIDSNGDSIPDLLIGAPGGDPGHAYLVLGRPRRPHLVPLSRSEGVVTIRGGSDQADRLGAAVAFAGDVDGDGLSDLLIGSPHSPGAPGGSAYLLFSRVGFPPVIDLSSDLSRFGLVFSSGRTGAEVGSSAAGVGDVDGDGFPDFAIGAPRSGPDPGAAGPGRAYLIFGGPRLSKAMEGGRIGFDLDDLPAGMAVVVEGPAAGSLLGASLAGGGDLDGDGAADLAVGAPGLGSGGAAFVIFGRQGFDGADLSLPDGTRASILTTSDAGWELGASLALGLDPTADGAADLLLGAPGWRREGPSSRGMAVLLAGGAGLRSAQPLDLNAPQPGAVRLTGGHDERAGSSVALVPDTGGDGAADLLVGGPGAKSRRGIVYLVNGGAGLPAEITLPDLDLPLGATLLHNAPDAQAGTAVAGLGDRNGDGYGDVAVGAPGASTPLMSGAGAAYEVHVPGQAQPAGAPREVRCEILPGRRILVSWLKGGTYRQVDVLRDGVIIATLSPEALFYIDLAPLPGEHPYSVRGNGDPKLTSNACRIVLQTLPVTGLVCEQVPGTTLLRLRWRLGDRYASLAIAVNGKTIRNDLPGDATSFEFDPGPGNFALVVYDPARGPNEPAARCDALVSSPPQSEVTGLNCVLSTDAQGLQGVDLVWDFNVSFKHYQVLRDGFQLELVEGTSYRDGSPPAGLRTYQVVGLAEKLHPSPPRQCEVEVPRAAGARATGQVTFGDSAATPIGRGKISARTASGALLGQGQPGADGRFEFALQQGALASLLFEVTLPPLGIDDPRGEHRIQVAAPASAGGDTGITVPVPVLAICGEGEAPSRWSALLGALEGRQEPDGAPRGALAFAVAGPREVARSVENVQQAIHAVHAHLRAFLTTEPLEIDLVAHGSSGLAARAWLHGLPSGEPSIRKLVLLGTPNLGTRLAALDAQAAAPKRVDLPGPAAKERDPFSAAVELLPSYLGEFHRRFTNLRGATTYLVAGLGGANVLDPILGCSDHDGRVCRQSAQALGGATLYTTSDTHESLGRSPTSVGLLSQILAGAAGGGGEVEPQGAEEILLQLSAGEIYSSILEPNTSGALELLSDTSGSIIILLNSQLPGVIDFRVLTPEGDLIDPATAGGLPGVGYHTFSDGEGHQLQSYEFDAGRVGFYTALLSYAGGTGDVPYSMQIFLDSRLTLSASLEPAEVEIGGASLMKAKLDLNGVPVPGADVEVEVHRPDGGFDSMLLRDDGQAPDGTAGDGVYSGSIGATPEAGLYLITVRGSGMSPLPFLREETTSLVVRSRAAAFAGELTAGTLDREGDGMFEGIWVAGEIRAEEAGSYLVTGMLTDLAGNPVSQAGVLFSAAAPGPVKFQLAFDGADIFASRRQGPYLLDEIELLDGNRGFILCQKKSAALTTAALSWIQFGHRAPQNFVRGDANGDGRLDLSDALTVLGHLFFDVFDARCLDAADANADRTLDIADAVYVLDALFMNGAPFPPPSPGCGAAPALGCERYDRCP
jgi:hypothetical protein